ETCSGMIRLGGKVCRDECDLLPAEEPGSRRLAAKRYRNGPACPSHHADSRGSYGHAWTLARNLRRRQGSIGMDPLIEIGNPRLVIWELLGNGQERQRRVACHPSVLARGVPHPGGRADRRECRLPHTRRCTRL